MTVPDPPYPQAPITAEGSNALRFEWVQWFQKLVRAVNRLQEGSGTPEGNVTASPGAIYVDTGGGAGVTLYVKETGVGTNTGWIAK